MSKFEAVILLSPDLSVDNLKKQEDSYNKELIELGGSIISQEDWGLRNLTYKINSLKKAFYYYFQINIEGQKIQTLKKNISQNEKIFRYLFIKVNIHDELPTKMLGGNE